MVIRRKISIYKKHYETIGQVSLFGHDNIYFKTVNLPNRQRFKDLCLRFKLKQLIKTKALSMKVIKII